MTPPIAATAPACYGMVCPHRATCQRYAAVAGATPEHTIATCADGAGGWPRWSGIAVRSHDLQHNDSAAA